MNKVVPIQNCIICLEEGVVKKEELYRIPCTCKIYCHKSCFEKTDQSRCFVCKNPYDYEWGIIPDQLSENRKRAMIIYKKMTNTANIVNQRVYQLNTNRQIHYENFKYRYFLYKEKCIHKCFYFLEILYIFFNALACLISMLCLFGIILILSGYFFNTLICLFSTNCEYESLNSSLFYVYCLPGMFILSCLINIYRYGRRYFIVGDLQIFDEY